MENKTIKPIEEVLRAGNDGKNQSIKQKFVQQHVFANVGSLVEYCLSKGFEDSDSPVNLDEIENYYSYPEWSTKLQGETLRFEGGTEEDKETFLEEFERLRDESQALVFAESISEETHEHNLELIDEAEREFNDLETEPAEIFEWWAVSSYLYDKLKENGYCVIDAGSCYIWGRTTTGQAILLDYAITQICADMGILEGQENEW